MLYNILDVVHNNSSVFPWIVLYVFVAFLVLALVGSLIFLFISLARKHWKK